MENKNVNELVSNIDQCILDAKKLKMDEAVKLLDMVRINIILRLNKISDHEFDCFLDEIKNNRVFN